MEAKRFKVNRDLMYNIKGVKKKPQLFFMWSFCALY